ncbi:hypothetical protein M8494_20025 [Serratia ureilytica]
MNAVKPAPGVSKVLYPGQNSHAREMEKRKNGIEIVDDIYQCLISNAIYQRSHDHKILRQLTLLLSWALRAARAVDISEPGRKTFISALSAIGRPAANSLRHGASPLKTQHAGR